MRRARTKRFGRRKFRGRRKTCGSIWKTTFDINAGDYTFRTTGSIMKFDGFLKVYQIPVAGADREDDEKDDEGEGKALPRVSEGQILKLESIKPEQHFTEPPPRYTEATLV